MYTLETTLDSLNIHVVSWGLKQVLEDLRSFFKRPKIEKWHLLNSVDAFAVHLNG